MEVRTARYGVISDQLVSVHSKPGSNADPLAIASFYKNLWLSPFSTILAGTHQNPLAWSILRENAVGPHGITAILEDDQLAMMTKLISGLGCPVKNRMLTGNLFKTQGLRLRQIKQFLSRLQRRLGRICRLAAGQAKQQRAGKTGYRKKAAL